MKSRSVETALERLRELRDNPTPAEARAELRRALASKIGLVAAKAATIAGAHRLTDLAPDLERVFDRFLIDGVSNDKGCTAKTEAVKALMAMECGPPDVFLRGMRYVQWEPVWGGREDTAGDLRGACAIALAQSGHHAALREIVNLLVDPNDRARAGAVRALGVHGGEPAVLLLRFKALSGDRRAEVLGECFSALLAIDPEASAPLVAGYLEHEEESEAEAAALALGEWRRPEAFPILKAALEGKAGRRIPRALLLGIGMLRLDDAVPFLLEQLASPGRGAAALAGLALYRHDERVRRQVEEAVAERPHLTEALRREFGSG